MLTGQLIEKLSLISKKLSGTVQEIDILNHDWPSGLKSHLEEIVQDMDMLIFDVKDEQSKHGSYLIEGQKESADIFSAIEAGNLRNVAKALGGE